MSAARSSVVAAYVAVRARDKEADASDLDPDSIEVRKAVFAMGGADYYALAWGITEPEHAALAALLAASKLKQLIKGYGVRDDRDRYVVTFGIEELNEVRQIKQAMVNIWRHLDGASPALLRPLAIDLGLIDTRGVDTD